MLRYPSACVCVCLTDSVCVCVCLLCFCPHWLVQCASVSAQCCLAEVYSHLTLHQMHPDTHFCTASLLFVAFARTCHTIWQRSALPKCTGALQDTVLLLKIQHSPVGQCVVYKTVQSVDLFCQFVSSEMDSVSSRCIFLTFTLTFLWKGPGKKWYSLQGITDH